MDYIVATLIVRMWSLIVGLILVCFGAGQAGFGRKRECPDNTIDSETFLNSVS